jgi:hypothetical protein
MVVMNDVVITDENLQSSGHTQVGNIEKSPLPISSYVQGCASAHRAEWRDVALPLPSDGHLYGHDIFINLLAFELGVLRLMRTPLQFYRRHGANASQSDLSDPKGVSQLRHVAMHGLADARPGWRHRIRILEALIQRMKDIRSSDLGPSGLPLESTIKRLETEKRALTERIDFCSIDRSRRAKRIWSFWRRGGYAVASGWKSALKDLVRPHA